MTSKRLTHQEAEILFLRAYGESLAKVAKRLQVSKTTAYRWEQVALVKLAKIRGEDLAKTKDLYRKSNKLYGGKMI